jgi:hypothetical protein
VLAVQLLSGCLDTYNVEVGRVTSLASAVMAEPHVGLALQVLAGGPYAVDRAVELARLIVELQVTD